MYMYTNSCCNESFKTIVGQVIGGKNNVRAFHVSVKVSQTDYGESK